MRDSGGEVICRSAWTPNDQGSFSLAEKPEGAVVSIEGEISSPYEHIVIMSAPVSEVDSVEYLVLLVDGKHNYCGMGFVKGTKKIWALSSGDVHEEG
jgi:hypothetical protein